MYLSGMLYLKEQQKGYSLQKLNQVSSLKVFCCFSSPFHTESQRHDSKNGNLQAAEE